MYSTYYLFYIFFTKILVKERLHNEKRRKTKKKCVQSTYKDTDRVESGIVKCKK